ncbi:MAG: hypothetical protein CL927_10610 [Deltaproteobacteria bacterium]|nr:hypothetical protein [Deltaproteobacteria bacterium]
MMDRTESRVTPDRRTFVRWISMGTAWVAVSGCTDATKTSTAAPCCDAPPEDTSAPPDRRPDTGTTGSEPSDTGPQDDSGQPGDTGEPVADCTIQSDQEGPFYTADAPNRADLIEADMPGVPIVIRGQIIDAVDCATPRAGAVLDVWHADEAGEYDNVGFELRGQVTCDAEGRFELRTIRPGRYPARPVEHIHFKIWASAGAEVELITSQIYFEGDPSHDPSVHFGPVIALDGSGTGEALFAV